MSNDWLTLLNDDDRVICWGPNRRVTMADFRLRINYLRAEIEAAGDRNWVLYDDDGLWFLCALFAVLASGSKALIPAGRNQAVIESMLKPDTGLIGFHSEFQGTIDIEVAREIDARGSDADLSIAAVKNWGKVVFCTSGSSGKPKLISKSARQLYLEAELFNRLWRPSRNTVFLPLVTHLHIYGLAFALLLPLAVRAAFYLPRGGGLLGAIEPLVLDFGESTKELVIVTSPTIGRQTTQLQTLAEPGSVIHDAPLPVGRVFCAGGKLSDANARHVIDLFDCPITEIFGSTESGAVATRAHQIRPSSADQPNPWQLLPGLDAGVVDAGGYVNVDFTASGEFAVWGGHVGGAAEQPILTGDEVRFVGQHRFELLGRRNLVCKIEGKRVSLSYIVEMLESCDLISEAAVLAHKKNHKEALLCALLLSSQGVSSYQQFGKSSTDQAIRQHLLRFIEPVLVPRTIRYLDRMPRNQMDKLPRATLLELMVNPVLPTLPLIEDSAITADQLRFSLLIPMELLFLRGHFENRPIVPGLVLLHWVYHFIGQYRQLPANTAVVNRLKFFKPTAPGDRLILTIHIKGDTIEFLYQGEQGWEYASGLIPLITDSTDV